MDLGSILGRIWGRIWNHFTRNVGFLGGDKTNKKINEKNMENAPKKLPTWRRRRETRRPFSYIFRAWGTLGSQHGTKTCPKRLLGLSWDGFGIVLGRVLGGRIEEMWVRREVKSRKQRRALPERSQEALKHDTRQPHSPETA